MNPRSSSRSGNAQKAGTPLHNYDFDFGLGIGSSKSLSGATLSAQKHPHHAAPPAPQPRPAAPQPRPAPSWMPQASPAAGASWTQISASATPARSMVGDISGKSWGALDTSKVGSSSIGLVGGLNRGAAPELFGDLLGSSLGRSSAPMKQTSGSSFTMDPMTASLPKVAPLKDMKASKMRDSFEMHSASNAGDDLKGVAGSNSASSDDVWGAFEGVHSRTNSAPPLNVHDPSNGSSGGNDDLFGDFQEGSASTTGVSSATQDPFAGSSNVNTDLFADFTKPSEVASGDFFDFAPKVGTAVPSHGFSQPNGISGADPFASLLSGSKSSVSTSSVSGSSESVVKNSSSGDPLMDALWSSTKTHSAAAPQNSDMLNDWGLETDFEVNEGGTTTELEGLPPPPSGVTSVIAKDKGMEYYKQGQFADAIKWLSWAENIMESSGKDSMLVEVLTCRASCLKEVGDYKKAVTDCSKVLELDKNNSSVLLQRALLYESTERYKLGIADLREVLKREPHNRVASNTLSRLIKMGE